MKHPIIAIGLLLALGACNNAQMADKQQTTKTSAARPELTAVKSFGDPDMEFSNAITAFQAKDNAGAARYISQAISELKTAEEPALNAKEVRQLDTTISTLRDLETRVLEGQVTDMDKLVDIFAHVDMLLAHDYLYLTQIYAVSAPDKASANAQKAEHRMEYASKKLKGDNKAECTSILDKVRMSLSKGDQKADAIGNAAGEHVEELTGWLKKHAEKLGINPPPRKLF